jgi:PAS domain S-box-containing protein
VLQELHQLRSRVAILEQVDAERHGVAAQLLEETRINETLNRIGSLMAAELDLQRLVEMVTDEATTLIGAEFGAFFYNLRDDDGESYTLYSLSGVPRSAFEDFPMPRNTTIFGPTFRGEGVVRIADVTLDPRFGQNPPYNGMPDGHLPVRSYLAVPVIDRAGEVLGGLFFGHARSGMFKERDERLVVGIAAQAAIAMDNARLVRDLEATRTRYRALFEGVSDIIIVTDGRWRIVDVNSSAVASLGYDRETLTSMAIGGVTRGGASHAAVGLNEAAETGQWQGEFDLLHANGVTLPVEVSTTRVVLPEQVVYVSVMRDISARRHVEKMQSEFTRLVSHELKAPLTSLKGFAQLLFRRATYDQRAVEVILGRTRLLERLINDLLDAASLEDGRLALYRETTDLSDVVERTVSLSTDTTDLHTITVVTPNEPVIGWWDGERIAQVIYNLMSNAIKYSPHGGNIIVRVEQRTAVREALVSVEDEGIGIPHDALPHLFSRFYRVEAVDTPTSQGIGLGLFIAHQLVESHGGRIWAEARPGGGSIFSFTLPNEPLTADTMAIATIDGDDARLSSG